MPRRIRQKRDRITEKIRVSLHPPPRQEEVSPDRSCESREESGPEAAFILLYGQTHHSPHGSPPRGPGQRGHVNIEVETNFLHFPCAYCA